MFDLDLIHTFIEVARNKNLNRTAQKLFITQSALSQRIKILESQIGSSLFLRKRSGMELNEFGKEFYDICSEIQSDIEKVKNWVMVRRGIVGGTVRICAVSGFVTHVMPEFLPQFYKKFSQVTLTVDVMVSEDIEDEILKGMADIGIIIAECKKHSLRTQRLCDNNILMVCSPDHSLSKKKKILNEDFRDSRMIWLSMKKSRSVRAIMSSLKISAHDRTGDLFLSDMDAAKKCAIEGLGVAFIPKMYIVNELKNDVLVSLPYFKMNRPAYLISRNEKYEPPIVSIFKKEFVKFCANKDY